MNFYMLHTSDALAQYFIDWNDLCANEEVNQIDSSSKAFQIFRNFKRR